MQKEILCKSICVILLAIFTFCFAAYAADQGRIRFQGIVMELSQNKKKMIVAEKTVIWNGKTGIYDDKGAPIPMESIKNKNWVYIDGVKKDKNSIQITATSIYLLPKFIERNERGRYSFMNEK